MGVGGAIRCDGLRCVWDHDLWGACRFIRVLALRRDQRVVSRGHRVQ